MTLESNNVRKYSSGSDESFRLNFIPDVSEKGNLGGAAYGDLLSNLHQSRTDAISTSDVSLSVSDMKESSESLSLHEYIFGASNWPNTLGVKIRELHKWNVKS